MDDRTARNLNPYWRARRLPVGQLHYPLPKQRDLSVLAAELEFGEREFLYHLPLLARGGPICNLGDGGSATIMALSLKDHGLAGQVHTVDISASYMRQNAQNRKGLAIDDRIVPLNAPTDIARKQFRGHSFRVLFIDADHSYAPCKKDFDLYSPLVVDEGIVAFHDVNQEDVDRVIQEMSPEWELLFFVNRIKAFRRSPRQDLSAVGPAAHPKV